MVLVLAFYFCAHLYKFLLFLLAPSLLSSPVVFISSPFPCLFSQLMVFFFSIACTFLLLSVNMFFKSKWKIWNLFKMELPGGAGLEFLGDFHVSSSPASFVLHIISWTSRNIALRSTLLPISGPLGAQEGSIWMTNIGTGILETAKLNHAHSGNQAGC